jgi:hypothetical protein
MGLSLIFNRLHVCNILLFYHYSADCQHFFKERRLFQAFCLFLWENRIFSTPPFPLFPRPYRHGFVKFTNKKPVKFLELITDSDSYLSVFSP